MTSFQCDQHECPFYCDANSHAPPHSICEAVQMQLNFGIAICIEMVQCVIEFVLEHERDMFISKLKYVHFAKIRLIQAVALERLMDFVLDSQVADIGPVCAYSFRHC